jgi:hypothetical protein
VGESQGRTTRLNRYYAVIERLAKHNDFFAGLHDGRYRVLAIFDNDRAILFDDLFRVLNEIQIAAQMLIQMDDSYGDALPSSELRELEAKLGWCTDPKGDAISGQLDHIVQTVERVFRPAIQATPLP